MNINESRMRSSSGLRSMCSIYISVVTCALTFLSNVGNVNGQELAPFHCETTSGQLVEIPEDLKGKRTILFLAFSTKAEEILDDWYEPVYTLFIDESGFNAMAYDCHVKLVMMFTGASQVAAQKIMEKIMSQVSPELSEYLLFHEGDFKEQMKSLGIKKENDAYVVVLDENGKVLTIETGSYTESKIEKIASLVEM